MIQSVSSILPQTGIGLQSAGSNSSASGQPSFGKYLSQALNGVNDSILQSQKLGEELAAGQVKDIHTVMIAAQKATLQLQLAVQVRNKAIEAYQEIMRMQV
ncbi:flagellar hook-basal body complex protein FliE [Fodinisporobacter ferrooxydans]|uniref:Flagellar hook-basal body complex protein FliE n=1 Tax=Fodinisporobacter ferrooxydans TaxID=2901836 RepID=A0ABY4CFQ8_9BACL|nr:flagellar hook-basal body complex protein FliE [Alicyclobacillaceae bacterium MYW30-H2]